MIGIGSHGILGRTTNGVRSFKEVILHVPPQQQGEAWARKSPKTAQVTKSTRINKELGIAKLKEIVSRLVEELFQTENLVKVKRILATRFREKM